MEKSLETHYNSFLLRAITGLRDLDISFKSLMYSTNSCKS